MYPPFYLSLVSLQIWTLHNSCTPNKCWKWERGAKHSQQWSKATNSKAFRTRRHTKALSLPPPARTNSRTLKLMSKRGATCLRSHWKLHWRTQCFVLVCALNQCWDWCLKVFGICFIEAYRHVTTALAYLKGSGAGRVIKQLHILILQIKPKKWVQNPLKYKRCFINVCWVNNWPLKHRLKKRCQCERFLRKCRGHHFPQSLASSHELASNPSPSTYTFHSTERLPRTHGNQAE